MTSPLLQRLRNEFDSSFERAVDRPEETVDILYLLVAQQRFALRIFEVKGFAKLDKLVPVPSHAEALAGITGLRGELLAVYDLAKLLKLPSSGRELKWIVTVPAQGQTLAIGFEAIAGYDRVAKASIDGASRQSLVNDTVLWRGDHIGLIDLGAVVRKICMEAEN